MDDEDREHWERVVKELGIPPALQTFLETTARSSIAAAGQYPRSPLGRPRSSSVNGHPPDAGHGRSGGET